MKKFFRNLLVLAFVTGCFTIFSWVKEVNANVPTGQTLVVPGMEGLVSFEYRNLEGIHEFGEIIEQAGRQYNLDPNLISTIIRFESGFNPQAVSSAGAKGLMQIMPINYRSLKINNPFDPWQNIMGGTKYLAYLLELWDGNLHLALASYHAGPGNVRGWVAKADGSMVWEEVNLYAFRVTKRYVEDKILPAWCDSFPRLVEAPEVNYHIQGLTYQGGDMPVTWNKVPGAIGYLISVRDLTSDALIVVHEAVYGQGQYVVQKDILSEGHQYRIAVASVSRNGRKNWQEVEIPANPRVMLYSFISSKYSTIFILSGIIM